MPYMRRLLTTLSVAVLAWANAADIGISPPRVELFGAPGSEVTTSVIVLTGAREEQQIATEVSDWLMDPSGSITFLAPGLTSHSAAEWIDPDADTFVLSASGSREVRFTVTIPTAAEGTHHAMVFFTVVPKPTDARGVGIVTTGRVGLTVYVTVAGTERAGSELADLYQADDRTITAVILNTGNTVMRLGGEIQLRDESGVVRHTLEVANVPVLRESERELTFELPDEVEPGFYVALALIQDSRGGVLAGELPLEVP
jgi:hypothetical protein